MRERGEQGRGESRLEVPLGEAGKAVLEGDRLALLRQLQPARRLSGRLREDGGVRGAAAPPGATAAAVEDRQLGIPPAGDGGDLLLRLEDLPLGRQIAAVLAGVGVPDHDLETSVRRDSPVFEELRDDAGSRSQVVDRLEERHRTHVARPQLEQPVHVGRRAHARDDDRTRRARAVALAGPAQGLQQGLRPLAPRPQVLRVQTQVECRNVKAEQLHATAKRGQLAVRDPSASVLAEAAVEQIEVGSEVGRRPVSGLGSPLEHAVEATPDEGQLPAVRLLCVSASDLRQVGGQLGLVSGERLDELRRDPDHARRDRERPSELPHVLPVATDHEQASARERLLDGVRAGCRIPVRVTADPRAERERAGSTGEPRPVLGEDSFRCVEQAALEEPDSLPDLVAHSRPRRADLIRLPDQRDLARQLVANVLAGLEPLQQPAQPDVRHEYPASRRLGRMRRQHELQRDARSSLGQLGRRYPRVVEALEGCGERLPAGAPFAIVAPPPSDPVVLLGQVGELKVDGERPQHCCLALEREGAYLSLESCPELGAPARPRLARERPDPLDRVEELGALLLDEHLTERFPEKPNIAAEHVREHDRVIPRSTPRRLVRALFRPYSPIGGSRLPYRRQSELR